MTRTLSLMILAVAALTPSQLTAQGHPITAPRAFTGTFATTQLGSPFGRTKYFGQTWYRGDTIPVGYPITRIGWRSPANQMHGAATVRLEVVLDNTPVGWGQLGKSFTGNMSGQPTVFYTLKNLNIPASTAAPIPDVPIVWLPADQPLVYLGPHFIVQTDVQTSTTPITTRFPVDGYSQSSSRGISFTAEASCGASSLAASYNVGAATYNLQLVGASPFIPVTFLVGVNNQVVGGALGLPLDLTPFGMTNCVLGLDPIADATVIADASGGASLSLPFTPGTSTLVMLAQAVHASNANPAGVVSTNVATSIMGTKGLSMYIYNWTQFGPTAQYGPYTSNRGQVLLVR